MNFFLQMNKFWEQAYTPKQILAFAPRNDVTNLACLSSRRLISYSVHKDKSDYQGAGEDGHYVC